MHEGVYVRVSKMMAYKSTKRLFNNTDLRIIISRKQEFCQKFVYNILSRCQSHWSNSEKASYSGFKEGKENYQVTEKPEENSIGHGPRQSSFNVVNDDLNSNKWKLELAWLSKALEPAVQLCRSVLPTGNVIGDKLPPTNRSLAEIFASIQRSKLGLQDWSLSDLTIGLYLIYLQQASTSAVEDVKGEEISSELIVQDLIYHLELAKGSYKANPAAIARNTMLRESNVIKFIKSSDVLRPGYYMGIDHRKKLVILVIRGTHTVYDLITDIISSSDEEITFEGYSTHFGTAEAARWFLNYELDTIRNCLKKHKGFRLRLVGHSLGGATASLLAIMLRQRSFQELGFSPDIVSAIGYGTPPCVSKELAENCSEYVTTAVMQGDIIPRLSVTSLTRLRNEILQTNWVSVLQKEDWRGVIDLFTNAKQVVSSVQDVAWKLADYTKLPGNAKHSDNSGVQPTSKPPGNATSLVRREEAGSKVADELFVPGSLYYLKRNADARINGDSGEYFTLLKRRPGEHFQRILLSSNIISDHKCEGYYYALRDVLKGLPGSPDEAIFR
ncbi:PREDICTED: uncharacterized protein LOC109219382 [Nicotiana attenuata]|uniref:Fungal lipase-type domain-containing protein n=1 Tax=Nicotiana attenuata TaxID=49451 RepID=A0A1J6JV87_NICAT|nr:PREDICTED: uncharacterized protein LOC109219382 [Nicotiana attenuata]OIT21062.1 hypothetical protein A4A49_42491 [Nicotiana attenuata]